MTWRKIRDNWFSLKSLIAVCIIIHNYVFCFFPFYSSYQLCCWQLRKRLTGKKNTNFVFPECKLVQNLVPLIITFNHLCPGLLTSIKASITWPNEINSHVFFLLDGLIFGLQIRSLICSAIQICKCKMNFLMQHFLSLQLLLDK